MEHFGSGSATMGPSRFTGWRSKAGHAMWQPSRTDTNMLNCNVAGRMVWLYDASQSYGMQPSRGPSTMAHQATKASHHPP
jgi:hypothetical protein